MVQFGKLVAGTLVQRDNRFRATALVDGYPQKAHVPNSGRLGELLLPATPLFLRPAARPDRVTAYDLVLVQLNESLVCIDARLPPRLIREAWESGRLAPFAGYDSVQMEVKCGNSRLDLRFESTAGDNCWVEAKSVTLVRDGVARFPDAPTERGRRHLRELTELARQGICGAVVFVVQSADAVAFAPNDEMDPEFGYTLRAARDAGVAVLVYHCEVDTQSIKIQSSLPLAF